MEKIIADRYKIVRKIATGGTSDIYLGEDIKLERKVAVKILSSERATDRNFIKRFKREAQILAKLSNPHIVQIYDWGEFNGSYYICMEYIDGKNLKQLIEEKGPLGYKTTSLFSIQICNALEIAHKNNLVHRDIKPQNILITKDNKIKVTDFGIAKFLLEDATKTIDVIGSVHYISPEQAQGEKLDPRSDIYSLGIVMYEMLTADVPFRGDNSIDISIKHISESPVKPSLLVSGIPKNLEALVMKCLQKDPDLRYWDITKLKEDILSFTSGKPLKYLHRTRKDHKEASRGLHVGKKTFYQKSRRTFRIMNYVYLSLISILLFLFIFFLIRFIDIKKDISEISVPPLINIDIDQATEILNTGNLQLSVSGTLDNTGLEEGKIARQDPPPGTRIENDGIIDIWISNGIDPESEPVNTEDGIKAMPNLIGLEIDEGFKILEDSSLEKGDVSEKNSSEFDGGIIIYQSIEPGTELEKDMPVDLVISSGEKKIIIPNLIGWDFVYASSHLESLGLAVLSKKIPDNNYEPGTVVSTDPSPGSPVTDNSMVVITVSTNEEMIEVPDILQFDLGEALNILDGSSINYEIRKVETGYSVQNDVILYQSPEPGDFMSIGSFITLYVGSDQ